MALPAPLLPHPPYVIAAITRVALRLLALSLRSVSSRGDVGGLVLNPSRVRGGMLVVWLLAVQTGLQGPGALESVMPVLAVMAGVVLAGLAGRFAIHPRDTPAKDERFPVMIDQVRELE